MNRITKLFTLAIASALATSPLFAANYPASAAGQNPSGYSAYADQDQYHGQSSDMGEERSFMRRADDRFNRLRQDSQNMYTQDRDLARGGYDPNESYYYGQTSPSYQGSYGGRQAQFGRQEQMMRGDMDYRQQGGSYNRGYEANMPQSYPLEESYPSNSRNVNYRSQGSYGTKGYGSDQQNHPREGSRFIREDGHVIKHEGDDQHPVYEYMLGKDGKWRNVSNQRHAHGQQSYNNYELGYNDESGDSRRGHSGDRAAPESYPIDENYPNAPRYDNPSFHRDNLDNSSASYNQRSSYDSREDRLGNTSSSYNVNRNRTSPNANTNWNTEEGNLDQESFNTSSSSTTKRNAQR